MKTQRVGFALFVAFTIVQVHAQASSDQEAPSVSISPVLDGNPKTEVTAVSKEQQPLPLSKPVSAQVDLDGSALAATKLKAEKGDATAQRVLGIAYYKGEGVNKDPKQATEWWRKAAKQGDAIAEWSLGLAYYEGKGVPRDYKQAVAWFRKAAEKGDPEAQGNLGLAYYLGLSVPESRVLAYMWLNIAVTSGIHDAVGVSKFRDELESTMTPDQITQAQKMASEWKTGQPDPGRRLALKHKTRGESSKKVVASSKSHSPTFSFETGSSAHSTSLDKTADSIAVNSKKAWKSVVDYFSKLKSGK